MQSNTFYLSISLAIYQVRRFPHRSVPQNPLAYSSSGEPIDVRPETTAWRVMFKGSTRAVRSESGGPLMVELDITGDELREFTGAGRFHLVQVDQEGAAVEEAPSAYVEFAVQRKKLSAASETNPSAELVATLEALRGIVKEQTAALTEVARALATGYAPATVKPAQPVVAAAEVDNGNEQEEEQGAGLLRWLEAGKPYVGILQDIKGFFKPSASSNGASTPPAPETPPAAPQGTPS